jgi:hypothetical protein
LYTILLETWSKGKDKGKGKGVVTTGKGDIGFPPVDNRPTKTTK